MDKKHLDDLFSKVNSLSANNVKDSHKAIDIAVRGFTSIEHIYNLLAYRDFQMIEDAAKEYMRKVDFYTKK